MQDIKFLNINSSNWRNFETELRQLCAGAEFDDSKASQINISWKDWESNPSSLMHALVIQKRFDPPNAQFTVLCNQNVPVACSGCYQSDWSEEVLIISVRTWTHPHHRDNWWHGRFLIPDQIEFAKKNNYSAVVVTFNESSKSMKAFFKRMTQGKPVVLGEKTPEVYKDFHFSEEVFYIRNCLQTISYLPLHRDQNHFLKSLLPPKGPA